MFSYHYHYTSHFRGFYICQNHFYSPHFMNKKQKCSEGMRFDCSAIVSRKLGFKLKHSDFKLPESTTFFAEATFWPFPLRLYLL